MFVLDTDVLSDLIRKKPNPRLQKRIRKVPREHLCTTAVSVMELRYGSALRPDHQVFWRRLKENILSRVRILRFDSRAAIIAGDLRAKLRRRGRQIGQADIMIAAVALTHGIPLVTRNQSHFQRIPGLRLEDWTLRR